MLLRQIIIEGDPETDEDKEELASELEALAKEIRNGTEAVPSVRETSMAQREETGEIIGDQSRPDSAATGDNSDPVWVPAPVGQP